MGDHELNYCFNKDCESVMRPMLGITVQTVESKTVIDSKTGLLRIVETIKVVEVSSKSLADGVFKEGDIFVKVIRQSGEEINITRQYNIIDIMLGIPVGETVKFVMLRDGAQVTLSVTLTESCLTAY